MPAQLVPDPCGLFQIYARSDLKIAQSRLIKTFGRCLDGKPVRTNFDNGHARTITGNRRPKSDFRGIKSGREFETGVAAFFDFPNKSYIRNDASEHLSIPLFFRKLSQYLYQLDEQICAENVACLKGDQARAQRSSPCLLPRSGMVQ